MQELKQDQVAQRLHQLTELSVALGDAPEIGALLERILRAAKSLTGADGGTLYRPGADPALFDVFVRNKVYLRFAHKHMEPSQVDHVDESLIPGYTP